MGEPVRHAMGSLSPPAVCADVLHENDNKLRLEHLKEIQIPAGVTEIKEFTFCGCEELEKVLLPSGLKSIGRRAFWGCKVLSEITIPEGTMIGEEAFGECDALTVRTSF